MKIPYIMLIESEQIKKQKTEKSIQGFYNFIPNVYNVILKLPFNLGKLADDNDKNMIKIQDVFQFFIYDFPLKNKEHIFINGDWQLFRCNYFISFIS